MPVDLTTICLLADVSDAAGFWQQRAAYAGKCGDERWGAIYRRLSEAAGALDEAREELLALIEEQEAKRG